MNVQGCDWASGCAILILVNTTIDVTLLGSSRLFGALGSATTRKLKVTNLKTASDSATCLNGSARRNLSNTHVLGYTV